MLHAFKSESVFCDIAPDLPEAWRICSKVREVGVPVLRDLQAGRHPHALMIHDVVEKSHQRSRAARAADDSAMQANRHHLGRRLAFSIQYVETVFEVGEELRAATQTLGVEQPHTRGTQ